MNFPSGEMAGPPILSPGSWTGSPPSIDTLHQQLKIASVCDRVSWKTTHLPSGEQVGYGKPLTSANCFGFRPSISILHIPPEPSRVEKKTMYLPSGDTDGKPLIPESSVN